MPRQERVELVKRIQSLRKSTLICYLTSLRPNVPSQMAEDSVRVMFDHLLRVSKRPNKMKKLDIFLASNGGSGTVPWRLVSLFREFAESICVLIPYRAYSAASLLALGADEIIMHPFGELGPIDPSVSNDFNPVEQPTGRRLGISVEDVRAYVSFIKSGVGITHEDELVKAVEILANKIHPLALGNVERFLSQSRMIATKILRTHMKGADDHSIKEIVENMASKLYFHGHPINRQEAKADLKLKITEPAMELEEAMWQLYLDFEREFENDKVFNPAADLAAMPTAGAPVIPVAAPQAPAPQVPAPAGAGAQAQGALPPAALAALAAMAQGPKEKTYDLIHAMVESEGLTSRHSTKRRYRMFTAPPGQAPTVLEEILEQGWTHSAAAPVVPQPQPSSSGAADAQVAVPKSAKKPARKPRRSKA